VDYSLFINMAVLVMWERLEKGPRMGPVAFPLQSSQVQPPFRGFVFLCRLLTRMPWGFFIYRFLCQARQSEMKTDDIGRSRKDNLGLIPCHNSYGVISRDNDGIFSNVKAVVFIALSLKHNDSFVNDTFDPTMSNKV
jgi:hypothetical protein